MIEQYCARKSAGWVTAISVAVVLGVGFIDYVTGADLSVSVFYLLPITFAAWFGGKRSGLAVAGLSAVMWLLADLATERRSLPLGIPLWNAISRLCIFLFVAWLLSHIRALQGGLEAMIQKRTQQLETETGKRVAMEREIADVSQREQRRIAHELHDGLGQELGGLAFQAKLLASKLAEKGNPISVEVERLVSLLNASIGRTRALSQLLDPVGRESGGLRPALNQLADQSGLAFDIACTLSAPETLPELSREAQLHLYRIAQEAVHNAVKHGQATLVNLEVALVPEGLRLIIADNGRGFEPQSSQSEPAKGMGLRIMQHRAGALGARVEVNSAPGHGCQLVCILPLSAQPPLAGS